MAKNPEHYGQFGWAESGEAYNGSYMWPDRSDEGAWVLRWPKSLRLPAIPVPGPDAPAPTLEDSPVAKGKARGASPRKRTAAAAADARATDGAAAAEKPAAGRRRATAEDAGAPQGSGPGTLPDGQTGKASRARKSPAPEALEGANGGRRGANAASRAVGRKRLGGGSAVPQPRRRKIVIVD